MREWLLLQRGFFNRVEEDYKNKWEMTRWQTFILMLPNAKKGTLHKPEDLMRFPWDGPKENPKMTEEEEREFISNMGLKFDNGKFIN